MEQPLKRNFVLSFFIILVSYVSGHKGCFEKEKKGLLELKEIMGFMNQSSIINNEFEFLLSDWVDIEEKNECCEWSRITCNHTTGHVIKISLGEMYIRNSWSLNLSLFLPFKELQSLNLSFSRIDGWTKSEGLTYLPHLKILDLSLNDFGWSIPSFIWELSTLKALYLRGIGLDGSLPMQGLTYLPHLEILDLSENYLGGSIPSFIWELSSLKALYLSGNELAEFSFSYDLTESRPNGTLHNQGVTSLPHLEILDLSWNDFGGSIPSFIWELSTLKALYLSQNFLNGSLDMQGFASLRHLEILDLSDNQFGGSIPPSIWSLSSLKALSLVDNHLNGSLPMQGGVCELKKVEELDFSYNNLEGTLPPCLNNLTSLRLLDLSRNQFTGNISPSLIASLTSLEYIDLSYNNFEGVFSFNSFANHSKLEVVEIISDNTKFVVETESTVWIPMLFQLKVLVLSNCNLNKLSGGIPEFLFHQHRLRVLDLSGSNLNGRFPYWLFENNTELEVLDLRKNSFNGLFHLPPFSNFSCYWMDLSENHFSGRIQENIGQILPNIYYFNLSANAFENGIPSSMGNMSDLAFLDLSANNFFGEFPHQVVKGCQLDQLILSYNKFEGEFPLALFNSTRVEVIKLDNNLFTGKLLNGHTDIYLLDISNNFFSGSISSWINTSSYRFVVLRNNLFQGQLPSELGPTYFLDASYNNFSGSLPLLTESTDLRNLHLRGNRFTGSIPESYVNLSHLLTLDLSDNNLSGGIPNYIGALPNLRILLLGRNYFTGFIPNQLCHLTNISLMDLSSNSLSGSIPNCLSNITGPNELAFDYDEKYRGFNYRYTNYQYETILNKLTASVRFHGRNDYTQQEQDEVDFVTKNRSGSYRGGVLDLISGLDFSCNNLTGEIPIQMGKLVQVLALNLSHNQLVGPIPKVFSRLAKIESLDLSFNSFSGEIPLELVDLTFLEVFIVAHNNLSGRIPEKKGQFDTFPKESFEGNPFLCGSQVEKKCTPLDTPSLSNASSEEGEEKWYEIDLVFFCASFVATYFVFLLGAATVLYINPYWRRRWFNLVEECMYSCYYFLCDSMRKRSLDL